jgi:hypothetical protein
MTTSSRDGKRGGRPGSRRQYQEPAKDKSIERIDANEAAAWQGPLRYGKSGSR